MGCATTSHYPKELMQCLIAAKDVSDAFRVTCVVTLGTGIIDEVVGAGKRGLNDLAGGIEGIQDEIIRQWPRDPWDWTRGFGAR